VLGEKSAVTELIPRTVRRTPADPPDLVWQHRAERVVTLAEEALWSSEGESALKYLLGRGLSTVTIRQARLGYVSGDYRARRTLEGLEVPCGITIPWFAAGALRRRHASLS
jgi:DNA primase